MSKKEAFFKQHFRRLSPKGDAIIWLQPCSMGETLTNAHVKDSLKTIETVIGLIRWCGLNWENQGHFKLSLKQLFRTGVPSLLIGYQRGPFWYCSSKVQGI